ncbi:MAG: alpha/beta hydrolase [Oscillospiraceae bacterium]|nr:alpha/beta hydrolase [Oscillospiraceae bacterium]
MSRFLSGFHSFGLQYEQKYITRADGTMLRICVYYPREKRDGVPGLLWLHGGGYALGVPEQDESFIKRFVEASGCVVVAPDYTLSLQKPYPAALEDSYAALLWLRDNGAQYGMRSDQIFVGGESAGGGLTAALSLYARDKAEVAIAFQMPLYPMLDDRPTESSANNDAPVWNTTSNNLAWQLYLGDAYGTDDVPIYAAPARAADYSGLPPACTYVGSIEPFFAETQTYVEKLRNSGVSVDFKVFDGAFHGFDIICPNTKIAKDARSFLMDCFKYAVENYFAEQPAGV